MRALLIIQLRPEGDRRGQMYKGGVASALAFQNVQFADAAVGVVSSALGP
jgi:hypothetical protein